MCGCVLPLLPRGATLFTLRTHDGGAQFVPVVVTLMWVSAYRQLVGRPA